MSPNWPLYEKELKIGILGMTEGNGHPYSWSAMFNGFDTQYMDHCPFAGIPVYLNKQPKETIGIPGARITHVCCDDKKDAQDVARCSLVEHVVDRPEDMIGEVDAVIVATDIGSEHVERCRPFIEADIPLFIDKPMVDNESDLRTFIKWRDEGKRFISSSSMRYVKSMEPYFLHHDEIGKLQYICQPMCKKWETYGIHALEGIFPLLGEGFLSIQNTGTEERNMLHITHKSGCDVHIPLSAGMYGAFGVTLLIGSADKKIITDTDSYYSFKKQLDVFVAYLRTGIDPFPFTQTIELMKLVIGGIMSREQGGRRVELKEIRER
ncbi:Gfo/Idh/MocA family oxidoreductase [Christensenellaceae bacterium OttesenSCG-928-M15]|nr:Gfo/Idh/MocA family oxidoreductase [Christensenellaceae bacterium OttesenSCG-928-M15]